MLREIDTNIWVAEQPLRYFGLNVGTRMTVIRLANKELAVISPIQVDDTITSQLNELGHVSHIIAPNLFHYLFVSEFKKVYPEAILWAAPGLELKRPELPIDRIITSNEHSFLDGIEYLLFEGLKTFVLTEFASFNECVFFHPATRTLILTDAAYYFDESFPLPLTVQLMMRVLGSYRNLSPSFLEKVAIKDKEKVRQSVQKVLAWDMKRVIMAHGTIVEKDAQQKLRAGYESFLGVSL